VNSMTNIAQHKIHRTRMPQVQRLQKNSWEHNLCETETWKGKLPTYLQVFQEHRSRSQIREIISDLNL